MSYDIQENSVEGGQPIELYELQMGAQGWKLTSAEDDVEVASVTYTAIEISRTSIIVSPQERNEAITISLPASHEFAQMFIDIVPGQIATIIIKRIHRTDTGEETIVIWYGRVESISFTNNGYTAEMTVKTLSMNMNSQIPRRTFQSLCNYVLYDTDCAIATSAHRFQGDITNVTGNTVKIDGITAAKGDGWSTGGFISYGGTDFRFIVKHDTGDLGLDVLELLMPFSEDMLNKTVDVYAGCDHSIETCKSKFDNVARFGGCPWVPVKNIFISGLD